MWLSDMLVTLKAGNGSVNFPRASGAPDRKGSLWALLAGCSLSCADLPLELYTCFTYRLDAAMHEVIHILYTIWKKSKLCRMTHLGRISSLHLCSGL